MVAEKGKRAKMQSRPDIAESIDAEMKGKEPQCTLYKYIKGPRKKSGRKKSGMKKSGRRRRKRKGGRRRRKSGCVGKSGKRTQSCWQTNCLKRHGENKKVKCSGGVPFEESRCAPKMQEGLPSCRHCNSGFSRSWARYFYRKLQWKNQEFIKYGHKYIKLQRKIWMKKSGKRRRRRKGGKSRRRRKGGKSRRRRRKRKGASYSSSCLSLCVSHHCPLAPYQLHHSSELMRGLFATRCDQWLYVRIL